MIVFLSELSHQNNGKASVVIEATRTVKDMRVQIECLKKENAALLTESQYVSLFTSTIFYFFPLFPVSVDI